MASVNHAAAVLPILGGVRLFVLGVWIGCGAAQNVGLLRHHKLMHAGDPMPTPFPTQRCVALRTLDADPVDVLKQSSRISCADR